MIIRIQSRVGEVVGNTSLYVEHPEELSDRVALMMLIDRDNAVKGVQGMFSARELFEALLRIMDRNKWMTSEYLDEVTKVMLPDTRLIVRTLRSIAGGLRASPSGRIELRDDNGVVVWDRERELAASVAAMLLDVAASLLEKPELVKHFTPEKIAEILDLAREKKELTLEQVFGKQRGEPNNRPKQVR